MTQPNTLRLVLGDQLNLRHSWFAQPQPHAVVVLMEVRQETDYVRHHAQKVLGIFAAMRAFAAQLQAQGHRVHYLTIDDPTNTQDIPRNLEHLAQHYRATHIQYQAPDEYRLDAQLHTWAQTSALHIECVDTEHFLTTRSDLTQHFKGKKQWLMESFYRAMRKRLGVLMDDQGEPQGGQWNFDADNRKPYKGNPPPPPAARPIQDLSALWSTIQATGIHTFGNPQASQFVWPTSRTQALHDLEHFVAHSLPHFGDFQDALSSQSWRLFHSLLSFALNTKMLHPLEVVQAAEAAYRSGHAPLHAVEGFIRQIIGWREYVRGVYWAHMPGYTQHNALQHNAPLPSWFWTGRTHMACMASAIGQSLEHAYAHHIQRLMVIGNFALLAGINPQALHEWYLGVYIDAFEWVEAPNTLGMSQRADGGIIATKPYVSSAAYLDRMGDHCSGCHYDKKAKTGERACPFNALYWDFFERHRARLGGNPRLSMVYRQLDQMAPEALQGLRDQATHTLQRLETL